MARKKSKEEVTEVKKTTKEVIAAIRASRKTKKGLKEVVEAPAEEIVNVAPGSETPDVLLDDPV